MKNPAQNITATHKLFGEELKGIPVVNPGDWFGKTWLVMVGFSFDRIYLVVEADSADCAVDELAESEEFGHCIVVDHDFLGDYDPDTCHYGPSGQVLDLDHITIYRIDPTKCRYHGDGIPTDGASPLEFCWD